MYLLTIIVYFLLINFILNYLFYLYIDKGKQNIRNNIISSIIVYVVWLIPFVIDDWFYKENSQPPFKNFQNTDWGGLGGEILLIILSFALFIVSFWLGSILKKKHTFYTKKIVGFLVVIVFICFIYLIYYGSKDCNWRDNPYVIVGSHFIYEGDEHSDGLLYLSVVNNFQLLGFFSDNSIYTGKWRFDHKNEEIKMFFDSVDNTLKEYFLKNDFSTWDDQEKSLTLKLNFINSCSYESAYIDFADSRFIFNNMESEYSKDDYYDPF